ncbi:MAG: hypothetical protein LAN37_16005 [Acidobacteriia bacterium]|nr:hypothetical protein [Terriglobia bacterium]
MAQNYFPGDCVLALTDQPSLALSLTFHESTKWRITVFDLREKRAELTDRFEKSLDAAKRFVAEYVKAKYGIDVSGLKWREVRIIRGEGAAG